MKTKTIKVTSFASLAALLASGTITLNLSDCSGSKGRMHLQPAKQAGASVQQNPITTTGSNLTVVPPTP